MYKNLIEIGLEKYLNNYFFNKPWIEEDYLLKINDFIRTKSEDQKRILLKKFNSLNDHSRVNDHFYELLIAKIFHPNGVFIDTKNNTSNSADMIDDSVLIEVKNINPPAEELDRINLLHTLNEKTTYPKDDYKIRLKDKFDKRFNKALSQLNNNQSILYIIWDTSLNGFSLSRKNNIQKYLNNLKVEKEKMYPNLKIRIFYFEDLRKLASQTS